MSGTHCTGVKITDDEQSSQEPDSITTNIIDTTSEENTEDIETQIPTTEPIESHKNAPIKSTRVTPGTLVYDISGSENGEYVTPTMNNDTPKDLKVVQRLFSNPVCGVPQDDIGISTPMDTPDGYSVTWKEQTVLKYFHTILDN